MSEIFRVRRHRIKIQRRTLSPLGWWVWRTLCETWAEIHADRITIRYQKDLLPGDRIIAGSDTYEVTAVIDRPGKTRLVELRIKRLADETLPSALAG